MSEKIFKERIKNFRALLSKEGLNGAIISSKVHFFYLMGFETVADSLLFVPTSEERSPIIFTSPLEEMLCRDSIPFKGIEIVISTKMPDGFTIRELEKGRFFSLKFKDSSYLITPRTLRSLLEYADIKDITIPSEASKNFINSLFSKHSLEEALSKALEYEAFHISSWNNHKIIIKHYLDWEMVASHLSTCEGKHEFGLEFSFVSHATYNSLINQCKSFFSENSFRFVDVTPLLIKMRMIKDEYDLKMLKASARIADRAMSRAKELLEEAHIKEQDVVLELEVEMKRAGAQKPSFDIIVLGGEKSVYPHGFAGDYIIKPGDPVIVDLGARYKGYCSDMTRTFIAGNLKETNSKFIEIATLTNQAYSLAISHVKPNGKWADPDLAVRKFFKEHNVLEYYTHSLGHGVGIEIHETPWVSYRFSKEEDNFLPGMVFTIEPGLYVPGIGGVRTENTVYLKENGEIEILNKTPLIEY